MKSNILWNRRSLTFVIALFLGACALLLAPTDAQAHSELVGSTPADDATLQKAPAQVLLEFNEDVQQQGGAITVTGPEGARYDISNTFTASGTEATVDLRDITEAGRFTVTYRIVSADGHVVQGEYPFRLQGGASPSASPSLSASDSPAATVTPSATPAAQEGDADGDGGGSVIWVLGLGAIGLALVAAMIAVFIRRGRG